MPAFQGMVQTGVPNVGQSMPAVRGYQSGPFSYGYAIAGVSRDSAGVALAGVTVKLFRTADDSLVSQTTSDANGAYKLPASPLFAHYLVEYKAGTPDVAGSSVNTLVGS